MKVHSGTPLAPLVAFALLVDCARAQRDVYESGGTETLNSTTDGVDIKNGTTGLLFEGTNITGTVAGILLDETSKLISYGGVVMSSLKGALEARGNSSATICSGYFKGGFDEDDDDSGYAAVAIREGGSILEVKDGTFIAGKISEAARIQGKALILGGLFQGGDGHPVGCGLYFDTYDPLIPGGVSIYGGTFRSGDSVGTIPDPDAVVNCSLRVRDVAFPGPDAPKVEVFGGTFEGNWYNELNGQIVAYGTNLNFDGADAESNGRLNGTLCDDSPIHLFVYQNRDAKLIVNNTYCPALIPTIQECETPVPTPAPAAETPEPTKPDETASPTPSDKMTKVPKASKAPKTSKASKKADV